MKTTFRLAVACGLMLVAGTAAVRAQMGGGADQGPTAALNRITQFLGKDASYTADYETRIVSAGQKGAISMPFRLSLNRGDSRMDMDLAKASIPDMSPAAVQIMQTMGLTRMSVLVTGPAEQKTGMLLYPEKKMACPLPQQGKAKAGKTAAEPEPQVLGEEMVDGRLCVKKHLATTQDGMAVEATWWELKDKPGVMAKMQAKTSDGTIDLRLAKLDAAAPAATLFQLPADCRKFPDMQQMMAAIMQENMQKMMQQ